MSKNIIKIATLSIASYFIYKKVNDHFKNFVKVEDVSALEIIEMLKDLNFQILLGYENNVVSFIKEDKSEAIIARLNVENEVYLIEYYYDDKDESKLESVYPLNVRLDNKSANEAYREYLKFLAKISTVEKRFITLVKEIANDATLADLTI